LTKDIGFYPVEVKLRRGRERDEKNVVHVLVKSKEIENKYGESPRKHLFAIAGLKPKGGLRPAIIFLLLILGLRLPAASQGLSGYISCVLSQPPQGYGAGMSFYSTVWRLIEKPLYRFQIGLAGTWIIPDNSDNATTPLCPIGTTARKWPERGPIWASVFQTLEGGKGYWVGTRFHYGPPKFSMNGTPNCYDDEIASPGSATGFSFRPTDCRFREIPRA